MYPEYPIVELESVSPLWKLMLTSLSHLRGRLPHFERPASVYNYSMAHSRSLGPRNVLVATWLQAPKESAMALRRFAKGLAASSCFMASAPSSMYTVMLLSRALNITSGTSQRIIGAFLSATWVSRNSVGCWQVAKKPLSTVSNPSNDRPQQRQKLRSLECRMGPWRRMKPDALMFRSYLDQQPLISLKFITVAHSTIP